MKSDTSLPAGDRLLRPGEARELLGMSPVTERKHLAQDKAFPSRLEISAGVFRYRLRDLRRYIAGLKKVRVAAPIPDDVHAKRDKWIADERPAWQAKRNAERAAAKAEAAAKQLQARLEKNAGQATAAGVRV